ncbi:ISL3 family transposase [Furfurilactobacillus milii]|uniref:ISL3 family transposase n=1 Tax=Furfurilactobacillus milii TaxID=2888272 RepID=A0A6N9HZR6_9LACO|nr:ISL3 family transposase [Furfurilactobacillus milii]MYV16362.1 ISL3 family transposase [Furfurilactobacillus milii]
MSHNDCTRRTLGITDANITFDPENFNHYERHGAIKVLVYEGKLTYQVSRCPQCGYENKLVHNGTKLVELKMPCINNYVTILRLHKQRFYCRNCHASFMAHTPVMHKHCSIADVTKKMIKQWCLEDVSEKEIAQQINISPSSVNRCINRISAHCVRFSQPLPRHICFDEFRSIGSRMSFICIDGDSHQLLELLPDRLIKTIKRFFNGFDLNNRKRVTSVVMDLNANYGRIIHGLFPNAKIVIDRFHLVQMLGRSLDDTRVKVGKQLPTKSRERHVLKSQWKVLKKPADKLDEVHRKYRYRLHEYLSDFEVIDICLSTSPKLKHDWLAYQAFLTAMQNRNEHDFEVCLGQYNSAGTAMDQTVKTFKKNLRDIKHSLETNLSNGPLEGTNRKIKQIKRTACGYHNLNHYFNRIWLEVTHH